MIHNTIVRVAGQHCLLLQEKNLVISGSPILTMFSGLVLLAVALKLLHLSRVNNQAARILEQDHGLDIVRGIGGNQSGRVNADKRLSEEAVKNL